MSAIIVVHSATSSVCGRGLGTIKISQLVPQFGRTIVLSGPPSDCKVRTGGFLFSLVNLPDSQGVMGEFIPEYLVREQAAVGALVLFSILRILAAAIAFEKGWRLSVVQGYCILIAVLYCLPQIFDLFTQLYGMQAAVAAAKLEGKAAGCAIALFFSPILSHKLGYE
jgi:hypothetical protein